MSDTENYADSQQAKYRTDLSALLAKGVPAANGCVEWPGYKNQFGYGRACVTTAEGKVKLVAIHRIACERRYGPIPKGKVAMHTCDNRACIADDHLRVGTYAENNADCRTKGRAGSRWKKRHGKVGIVDGVLTVIP